MAGTIATINAFGNTKAILLNPYSMSHLLGGAFLYGNGTDGSRRTNLRATITFRTTIPMFVVLSMITPSTTQIGFDVP